MDEWFKFSIAMGYNAQYFSILMRIFKKGAKVYSFDYNTGHHTYNSLMQYSKLCKFRILKINLN
jgi:hypothetical protein